MNENVKKARDIAVKQHADQCYNDKPYSYHLDQVYDLICEAQLGMDFQMGAYLHDTLEDTDLTYEFIQKEFNENVAQMVFSVSGFGHNRKEKHLNIKTKLMETPQNVNLKMADRIVNMRNCVETGNAKLLKMYMGEMDSFKELFSQGCDYYKDIFKNEFNYPLNNKIKLSF